tara:strand:- start:36 stop:554 length:519 start_codon:yes stop_codon:yes gene_type:complete
MANFKDSPRFDIHDDYYTRKETWKQIIPYLPTDKTYWEFCSLGSNGQSIKNLKELGLNVIGSTTHDFLKDELLEADILITNPPFDKKIKIPILEKLAESDKPFIIIMNSTNIFTKYFNRIFGEKDIKFIYPSTKIHFDKYEGTKYIESKNNTSFYSLYVCYNIPTITKNIFI